MAVTKDEKQQIIKQYGDSESNTGSSEAQIALFTRRIEALTGHLQEHKHDHDSRRGLLKLVGKRRSLLDYLYSKDIQRYRKVIADLGIRK